MKLAIKTFFPNCFFSLECFYNFTGSKDLLAIAASTVRPPGLRRADDRPSAYVIGHSSIINTPTSKVVPRGFPMNYSLLIAARQKLSATGNDGGYLLTLNNMFG